MKRFTPILFAVLTACSAGGGSVPAPQPTQQPPTSQKNVGAAITIQIGGGSSTGTTMQSATRRPMYVSHSTDDVEVYVAQHGAGFSGVTPAETDVSPGSAACGGQTGPRTCTIYVYNLPTGSADFLLNTYDQVPTNASTHAGKLLSTGETDNVSIITGGTTNVTITLLGVPASLAGCENSSGYPVPALDDQDTSNNLGKTVATSMCVRALDADGNVINANAPLAPGYHVVFNSSVTGLTLGTTDVNTGSTINGIAGGFVGTGTYDFYDYQFPTLDQTDEIAYTAQLKNGVTNIGSAYSDNVPVFDEYYYPSDAWTQACCTSVTNFNVIESGYSGSFHAAVDNTSVATITPSVLTQTAAGTPAAFTVAFANVTGVAHVTITDDYGNSLTTEFDVSNTGSIGVGIQSRRIHRHARP